MFNIGVKKLIGISAGVISLVGGTVVAAIGIKKHNKIKEEIDLETVCHVHGHDCKILDIPAEEGYFKIRLNITELSEIEGLGDEINKIYIGRIVKDIQDNVIGYVESFDIENNYLICKEL